MPPVPDDDNVISFINLPVEMPIKPSIIEGYKSLNGAIWDGRIWSSAFDWLSSPDALRCGCYITLTEIGNEVWVCKVHPCICCAGIESLLLICRIPKECSDEELLLKNTTMMEQLTSDVLEFQVSRSFVESQKSVVMKNCFWRTLPWLIS